MSRPTDVDGTRSTASSPRRGVPPRPRTRAAPLVVLALFAMLPALALFALFRWADGSIDTNEAAPITSEPMEPPPFADPLTTSMLSLRRFPTTLSRNLNIAGFEAALVPFLSTLNDRSCAAVAVDGISVGARNPELPVIPASNQKLLVGAVAIDILGADTRFTTSVTASAPPIDGTIAGDLALVGGGDPLLSSDWYATSNLERYPVLSPTSLDSLADSVRDAGITSIEGNVVGDGSRYDDEFFAPGWGDGVAGLEGGPYDALMANDSRVLGEDQRAGDPNAGAAREFARLLTERGISVSGTGVSGVGALEAVEIASVESAPMSDVIGEMLANSDNNTAEMLLKEIGLSAEGVGGREAGARQVIATLGEWNLDTGSIVVADGSGLSPDNRATCAVLLAVLERFAPDSTFGAGLPIAGSTGTLSDIFVDHPIAGRMTGKTGTLNNPPFNADPPAVKALSGYVPVEGGTAIEYSLILNGPTISDQSEYRAVWYALADVLDTYPAGATPAELGPR